MLLDRNGKDLMTYSKKYVVVIDSKPFSLNNVEENIEELLTLNFIMKSQIDDFTYDDIMKKVGKNYFQVNQEVYSKVNKLTSIKGVYTYIYDQIERNNAWGVTDLLSKLSEKNTYAKNSLEEQLLNGIEENKLLQGTFNTDKDGHYISQAVNISPSNKNIQLTLDSEINKKVKDVLGRGDYSSLGNIGVLLMDSTTGEILSMAQKDESQPNILIGAEGLGYEPASVFKLIVEAAALDEHEVKLTDKFACTGTICQKEGKPYAHGELSVRDALMISCNDVFYRVSQKVGYDKIMNLAEKQGLYSKVLDLTREVEGSKPLEEASLRNIAIGQSMTVTPIQMLGAVNTIVNDGTYIKPQIVKGLVDIKENIVENFLSEKSRIITKETSRLIKENMVDVVKKGTGYNASVAGIEIGGKTGSATGSGGTTHGWFAGYFKNGSKSYTMIVFAPDISGKNKEGQDLVGGNTGAPVFRDIVLELVK